MFRKCVMKIQVSVQSDKITGTVHEDICKFMTISDSLLRRMRNVSDICCRKLKHIFYVQ
jgi:hypothetical protein